MVTLDCTVTFALPVESATTVFAVPVAARVAVQVEVPAVLKAFGVQLSEFRTAADPGSVIVPLPPGDGMELRSEAPVAVRLTVTVPLAVPERTMFAVASV